MKNIFSIGLLVIFALSSKVHSATIFTDCNSCSSFTEYKAMAESAVPVFGTHTVYVTNLSRDEIQKFQVEYEMAEPPSIPLPTFYTAQLPYQREI